MDIIEKVNWNKITPCLLLLLLELLVDFTESTSQAEVNKHLELGKDFLARGQFSDALTHYHAAVEGDPHNYLTYFKRGTVYYALGKAKFSLADFSKVLELKSDFTAARANRASVHLKLASYNDAKEDYYEVYRQDRSNEDALAMYHKIDELVEDVQLAEAYYRGHDFAAAVELTGRLLEYSPWSAHLRQLRAESYIGLNDVLAAISDIRSATRLQQDSTAGYFRLATLLYQLGHVNDALKEIRECLKLDPEHSDCFPLYKKIKKVDKLLTDGQQSKDGGDYQGCMASARKVLRVESEAAMVVWEAKKLLCSCGVKEEEFSDAVRTCQEALELHEDEHTYCDKAEAYIGLEMYDDAVHEYNRALRMDEGFQRAKDGLNRAQKLQKQSEQRDYYKILGVKRSANKQEIVKAYRKAAQKWHPDNYATNESEKKIAEKKFIDIAAAKEVLTDPEKRAMFDAGNDPLDPEANRQGGGAHGNPFSHFQHGSPFQFRFHFN